MLAAAVPQPFSSKIHQGCATGPPSAAPHTAQPFNCVSWTLPEERFVAELQRTAYSSGVALLRDLGVNVPLANIKRLFDRIYTNPAIIDRLNALYPKRGIFKDAALRGETTIMNTVIDRKVPFDLSHARMMALAQDPETISELGPDFQPVLEFFRTVEQDMIPRLNRVNSFLAGIDLSPFHMDKNYNYRCIDYFPVECEAGHSSLLPRCGEHRDYGTFTLIFQDQIGGLECKLGDTWIPVPAGEVVLMWGWCSSIVSNDRIKAALHRVVAAPTSHGQGQGQVRVVPRRTTAVFFVAPDTTAPLRPVLKAPGEPCNYDLGLMESLTVAQFKNVIGKKWRRREGSDLDPEEDVGDRFASQDQAVEYYLRGGI
eukprot:CAMPEP_0196653570 /NCGR_PEP_ID=MMETSP1086-20130531/3212_1 /TAXON_ID=77921 /ORGANISM="Cyanoptyche  gloeocystis , Strain SAG4.97" /LENGTH=369 /DNA_ID=CAMNT_0041984845 /DNA_START=180 /DNA_END=1289 /DNA_ORIENTATION=+